MLLGIKLNSIITTYPDRINAIEEISECRKKPVTTKILAFIP